eukprot:1286257-Pyramimonas_sp.AAC.2
MNEVWTHKPSWGPMGAGRPHQEVTDTAEVAMEAAEAMHRGSGASTGSQRLDDGRHKQLR